MKTYDTITLYKVNNGADDLTFHGYTTTSLSSRFASLKREADNPRYTTPVHKHIHQLGKERFKISHVVTLKGVTLDEVKTRLTEFDHQAEQNTDPNKAKHQEGTEPHTEHQAEAEPNPPY